MSDSPDRPHRRSIRLRWYDYTQSGAYFVTVCTHHRQCLFGDIVNGTMQANTLGQVVQEEWSRSVEIRREVRLDAFVVMPNHIHGIVVIRNDIHDHEVGAHGRAPLLQSGGSPPTSRDRPARSLGSCIAGFKAVVTKRINEIRGTPGAPVWQRNYYEHVIRSDDEMTSAIQYITDNPARWAKDAENPMRTR